LPIELPPLRDRGNDLLILAKRFVQSFCTENGLPGKIISEDAIHKLRSYSFPGNIRELRSIMELAVTLTDDEEISSNNIILGNDDILPDVMENELSLREYNIKIVNKYLEKYDNNIKLVAQKLDIGVATIYRMLKQKPTK
jgi:DNA-binding NtrC family response regulator